jgi:hypothetical protein
LNGKFKYKFKKYNILPKVRFLKNTSGYLGDYLVQVKIREGYMYELIRVIYWKIDGELEGLTSYHTILKDFDIGGERYLYIKWKVDD